jgi:hypothetical protein
VLAAEPKFKLLAHNTFEDDSSRANASIAAVNGELLLRTDQALYCIANRPQTSLIDGGLRSKNREAANKRRGRSVRGLAEPAIVTSRVANARHIESGDWPNMRLSLFSRAPRPRRSM